MRCPRCRHENPTPASFCQECGARLVVRCVRCEAGLPASARFCHACGTPQDTPPERDPRDYTPRHLADGILASRSALEGERKQVTVLFADVKGSLELAQRIDPEAWHRLLDRFFRILTEGVHRFEGTVNQYTGDGIMALFGAPLAHEDHAQRACHAALELRDELRRYAEELRSRQGLDFAVRIGLNSGEVVVGKIGSDLRMDYTAQGHSVGLAARMEQLAEPGNVFLTQHTAELVQGFFRLRPLGEAQVPGVAGGIAVYELEHTGDARTRLDLAARRGFTRLVGRKSATAALEAALEQVSAGAGLVVGVEGEAGIGKSRLCLEFVERCRAAGLRVVEAHCPSHGRALPLRPVIELLRAWFGIDEGDDGAAARRKVAAADVFRDERVAESLPLLLDLLHVADPEEPPPPAGPEESLRRLLALVQQLVRARSDEAPLVVLVDDLHWIDAQSEPFVAALCEALEGTGTLLLLNFRPEYRAEWMASPVFRKVGLVPLRPEESDELLRELLGDGPGTTELATRITRRTGGNPFFMEEVVRSLSDAGRLVGRKGAYQVAGPVEELGIPVTVQPILAARIDRLGEVEKHVLQVASVMGVQFTESLMGQVCECSGDALDRALQELDVAEFIQRSPYRRVPHVFKHPLTQEMAYRSMLSEQRQGLHAAVARAIEEEGERLGERAELVAHHWEGAGRHREARRWRLRASFGVTHLKPRRRRD